MSPWDCYVVQNLFEEYFDVSVDFSCYCDDSEQLFTKYHKVL